jgi:protein-S-isoprenylcysteine O-methyltransferase Ste14
VTLQLATFAGLTLWLLPTYVMSQGDGRWSLLLDGPIWRTSLILQLMALAAVPAVSSVVEFAVRGRGTPYPCDPPSELVTTGPYAYVANPMQLSAVLVLGLLAVGTCSWSLVVATIGMVAFSEWVAEPHERGELPGRFGPEWDAYTSQVRRWVVRRTPYEGAGAAELYLADSCVICRQTRGLVESTGPHGLTLQVAEEYAGTVAGLQRVLYVGPDGLQARGLAAVARGFEHSGLGWAYLGWLLRLPVLRPVVQLLLDGMGGGPRQLSAPPDRGIRSA